MELDTVSEPVVTTADLSFNCNLKPQQTWSGREVSVISENKNLTDLYEILSDLLTDMDDDDYSEQDEHADKAALNMLRGVVHILAGAVEFDNPSIALHELQLATHSLYVATQEYAAGMTPASPDVPPPVEPSNLKV
jgi:hypothetical protein